MPEVSRKIPKVSVIIVNYNGGKYLQKCVDHLAAQTLSLFEAFIVDNNSEDGSAERLALPDDRFELIRSETNLGFAAGNNLAARRAEGQWLACLNPDAFADMDWLKKLVEVAEAYPNCKMAGSLQIAAETPDYLDGAGDNYHITGLAWRGLYQKPVEQAPPSGEVFAPCAAAALYDREMFLQLCGFDEDFFCYHEDVDLGFRFRLLGAKCLQINEAQVHHIGSALSGRASDFSIYYGTRNRIWTFVKCLPLFWLLCLWPAHMAANFAMLIWSVFRGRFKPTFRGMRHAVMGFPKIWAKRKALHNGAHMKPAFYKVVCWNPLKVIGRGLKINSLDDQS